VGERIENDLNCANPQVLKSISSEPWMREVKNAAQQSKKFISSIFIEKNSRDTPHVLLIDWNKRLPCFLQNR
jgi:hypothetical protein